MSEPEPAETQPATPTARTGTRIVALYHIGKTGGSSFLYSGRWSKVFNYFHTQCFFAMPAHRLLFPPEYHNLNGTSGYINRCARKGYDPYADYNESRVLVEFHGISQEKFWSLLFKPRVIEGLRMRHRKFLTAVMLRDPVPHIFSSYTMWGWVPSRADRAAGRLVHRLAEVLHACHIVTYRAGIGACPTGTRIYSGPPVSLWPPWPCPRYGMHGTSLWSAEETASSSLVTPRTTPRSLCRVQLARVCAHTGSARACDVWLLVW